MRSRDASVLALGIVIALAVLVVAAGIGGFGMTSTGTVTESPGASPVDPPADGSSGIVFDLRHTDARRFLGITYRGEQHEAHIAVVVPPECIRTTDAGVEELRGDGACADLPVRGDLSGGGTTITGEEFVLVRLDVSRDCYEQLERGDSWPAPSGACTGD